MIHRRLGASTLSVSVISFGAWQIGDSEYWGLQERTNAEATVQAAIDAGINLFDTAEMYGRGESERVLGRALGKRRKDVLVASKVLPENCRPESLRCACEGSLSRLGTDYIDLYQVHWPFRDAPFEAAYEVLDALKTEGKIREIGVSNFGVQDLKAWMSVGNAASNQLGYNLAFRAIENEILPACRDHNLGVLAYMPLLQGILTCRWKTADEIPPLRRRTRHFSSIRTGTMHLEPGCEDALFELVSKLEDLAAQLGQSPATLALAWLMAQPGVTSVILGARDPVQLTRNLTAADLALSEETLSTVEFLSNPLKECLGPNADMWRSGEAARIR